MTTIRLLPDAVLDQAGRYREVVARVESAADELLRTLQSCEAALGREVQDTMAELCWSARHGLAVLAHDHGQIQAGLTAVGECFRQLDHGLFK